MEMKTFLQFVVKIIIASIASVHCHMTSTVGVIIKDHKVLLDYKFKSERYSSRVERDTVELLVATVEPVYNGHP